MATMVFHRRWISVKDAPSNLRVGVHYWVGWLPFCFVLIWTTASILGTRAQWLIVKGGATDPLEWTRLYFGEVCCFLGTIAIIWLVSGREVLTFENGTLIWRRETLGIGWSRKFVLADVRDIRVGTYLDPVAKGKWKDSAVHASICFESRGKSWLLGNFLGTDEARRILGVIRQRHPEIFPDTVQLSG